MNVKPPNNHPQPLTGGGSNASLVGVFVGGPTPMPTCPGQGVPTQAYLNQVPLDAPTRTRDKTPESGTPGPDSHSCCRQNNFEFPE